jgi:hypothetical protein
MHELIVTLGMKQLGPIEVVQAAKGTFSARMRPTAADPSGEPGRRTEAGVVEIDEASNRTFRSYIEKLFWPEKE